MHGPCFYGSLTRISDLATGDHDVRLMSRDRWGAGDYVLAEVVEARREHRVELSSGRHVEPAEGDGIVGAFGTRHATLEATGDWRAIEEDGELHLLTAAGLLGRCTSRSYALAPLVRLRYRGHLVRGDRELGMSDFVAPVAPRPYATPTILIVGTSMSAGKTTAARILIRTLKRAGRRVAGAKLTGAGRYRDILGMRDAGADGVFDFVDVGLPSTVCPRDVYEVALAGLLARLEGVRAEVAVVEAGASPLEPYNGEAAIAALGVAVRFTVLCASDPYAVAGVMQAFDRRPDLVTGIASNTRAGVELVERLTGVRTLDLRDPRTKPALEALLGETFAASVA